VTSEGRPSVVALGGGHGLSATLRAVREYAGDVTAIVSAADDGGSSGRLRESFPIPSPGDVRKCLVALGEPDGLWSRAFEYRFEAGELEGHALGNLVLAALAGLTGDFTTAIREAGLLVGAKGRVLPATTVPVVLKAEADGGEVRGQVAVQRARRIARISIVPPDAPAPPEAVEAILGADQVVIGPGSLFTSVLAVVAVPALREALRATRATRVYVCNLYPEVPETEGYDVAAHVAALEAHGLSVDVVVCDPTHMATGKLEVPSVEATLGARRDEGHDPKALAAVLSGLLA
jgi:uncharacterized cofD-like protein